MGSSFRYAEHVAAFAGSNHTCDALLVVDEDTVIDVHAVAAARLGFARNELIGRPVRDCLRPDPDAAPGWDGGRGSGLALRSSRGGPAVPVAVRARPWATLPGSSVPGATHLLTVTDLVDDPASAWLDDTPVAVLRTSADGTLTYADRQALHLWPELGQVPAAGTAVSDLPEPDEAHTAREVTLRIGEVALHARAVVDRGADGGLVLWCQSARSPHARVPVTGGLKLNGPGRTLLNLSNSAVLVTDVDLNPRWSTTSVRTCFPYHPLRTTALYGHVSPASAERLRAGVHRLLGRPGAREQVRIALVDPQRQLTWVDVELTNLLHDPSVDGLVMTLADVTKTLVADQLRASWRRVLHAAGTGAGTDTVMQATVDGLTEVLSLHRDDLSVELAYPDTAGGTTPRHVRGAGAPAEPSVRSLEALDAAPTAALRRVPGPCAQTTSWLVAVPAGGGATAALVVHSRSARLGDQTDVVVRGSAQLASLALRAVRSDACAQAAGAGPQPPARISRAFLHVSQIREDERRRAAVKLHDGPAQELAAALWKIDDVFEEHRDDLTEEISGQLSDLQINLERATAGLREAMSDLRVPVETGHLVAAVTSGGRKLLGDGVELRVHDDLVASPGAELSPLLFRTTLEALRNAGKHAYASEVVVRFHEDAGSVVVDVIDNGTGFDPTLASVRSLAGHMGLSSMREEVNLAGGTLTIGRREDGHGGAQLTFSVPLPGRATGHDDVDPDDVDPNDRDAGRDAGQGAGGAARGADPAGPPGR